MATAAVARHNHHTHHHPPSRAGGRRRGGVGVVVRCSSPAQEFASLAVVFRRQLVVGAATAAAAAVGANFGGVTSFLLDLSPRLGRSLRLDVLYPVAGFTRCLDSDNGFATNPQPGSGRSTPLRFRSDPIASAASSPSRLLHHGGTPSPSGSAGAPREPDGAAWPRRVGDAGAPPDLLQRWGAQEVQRVLLVSRQLLILRA